MAVEWSLIPVLLSANSLLAYAQLQQETGGARQQSAVWKISALTAHGPGLLARDVVDRAMADTNQPPSRLMHDASVRSNDALASI